MRQRKDLSKQRRSKSKSNVFLYKEVSKNKQKDGILVEIKKS